MATRWYATRRQITDDIIGKENIFQKSFGGLKIKHKFAAAFEEKHFSYWKKRKRSKFEQIVHDEKKLQKDSNCLQGSPKE